MKVGAWMTGALLLALPSLAQASEAPPCSELPDVAWNAETSVDFQFLVSLGLPRVPSAKDLYIQALCGVDNAAMWDLVDSGKGAMLSVPQALIDPLHELTPNVGRVTHVYVRGGGRDREIAVILMAEGYEGPIFEVDAPQAWPAEDLELAKTIWNGIPYEPLRIASQWTHEVARYESEYSFSVELLGLDITLFTQKNRALAPIWGTVLMPEANASRPDVYLHELTHMIDWSLHGTDHLFYAEGFSEISRINNSILGVRIPLWFSERYPQSAEFDCKTESYEPHGHVSRYSRCGELSVEDYGDSLCMALAATQAYAMSEFDGPLRMFGPSQMYDPSWLYGRTGNDDASVLAEKASWLEGEFGIRQGVEMDADGDGVPWKPGLFGGDCDDTNPVIGSCEDTVCSSNADCDDADPCTNDLCSASSCIHTTLDSDADGSPDGSCGGSDCADDDPTVGAGTVEDCSGACGIQGVQVCNGGVWSACSAPPTCDCEPGSVSVEGCGSCSTATRVCADDGSWNELGPCTPTDPTSDGCAPGTVTEADECGSMSCDGSSIDLVGEYTCDATCTWQMTQACTPAMPTTPEVCNGSDDDCDGTSDEGCPQGLQLSSTTPSGWYGGTGGTLVESNCFAGDALVGLRMQDVTYSIFLNSHPVLGDVSGICGNLDLETSGIPYTYEVDTGGTYNLSFHNNSPSSYGTFMCPGGQVLTGADLGTGWYVDRIRLRCGAPTLTGSYGSYGMAVDSGVQSGTYFHGNAITDTYNCPAGSVMTGLRSRSGDVIDALAFNCATLGLDY